MTAPEQGPVVVSGATGLVGGRLLPALLRAGHPVRALTRDPSRARFPGGAMRRGPIVDPVAWDGVRPPPEALSGAAAVVHLAGEPVFGGLLTAARRARVRESRVRSTEALVEALGALPPAARPRTLACASAVGYYGDRGEQELDEAQPPGDGFLAEVCVAWEAAAARATPLGVRVVSLRIGIVLAREGGALPQMALPVRFGLGGPLGNGRQWVPWIQLDDLVALTLRTLDDASLAGPVNAVAPAPARNADLTAAIARRVRRPAFVRVPAFVLRAALGDLAVEVLGSRRCVPRRALDAGFRFAHESLESALAEEL